MAKLAAAKIHEKQNNKLQLVNFERDVIPLGCCNFIENSQKLTFHFFMHVKLVNFIDFLLKVFS